MISSIRPKTFIPIHGTYSHLHSNANIPKELGLDLTTIEVENGDVIDLSPDGVKLSDRITVYHRFVDSESYIPLKYETMRERLRIGELGLAVVTACFDPRKKELVGDLQITLQGLPARVDEDMGEIEDICRKAAKRGIHHELKTKGFTSESLADAARVEVRRGLFSVYRKKPVVLVHVHAL